MIVGNLNVKHDIKVILFFEESGFDKINKLVKIPSHIKKDFKAKQTDIIPFYNKTDLIVLGCLGSKDIEIDGFKKKIRSIISFLKNYPNKKPLFILGESMEEHQIQIIYENYYKFDYKTGKSSKKSKKNKNESKKHSQKSKNHNNKFYIYCKNKNINPKNQMIMAESIELLKNLGDEPSNKLTPDLYIKRIKEVCKEADLIVKIYNSKILKKMGFYSLLSVSQGSNFDGYLVEIHHKHSKEKPMILAGKGITFDTGGISIKGSRSLYEMKGDMIGSAIVLSTMRNLGLMKVKKNVIGLLAIAENMPDSNAIKPGDVVKSHSGKTIEIMDTDAEGRLVLADALSYSMKFKPRLIIDIATLTGQQQSMSCGLFGSIMGFKDETIKKLIELGDKTGDRLVKLPLYQEFINHTKSKIADVKNSEYKCRAGTIQAGAFLSHFVKKESNWIHLDVAGPTFFNGRTQSYGVRLLTKIVKEY